MPPLLTMAPEPMPLFENANALAKFLEEENIKRFQWVENDELFDFGKPLCYDPGAHFWRWKACSDGEAADGEAANGKAANGKAAVGKPWPNEILYEKVLCVLKSGITVNYL